MDLKQLYRDATDEQRDALLKAAGVTPGDRRRIRIAAGIMSAGSIVASIANSIIAAAVALPVSALLWPVFKGAKSRLNGDPATRARFAVALQALKDGEGVPEEMPEEVQAAIRKAMDRRGPASTLH